MVSLSGITAEQAKWIALKHLGFPEKDTDYLVSIEEGSTETRKLGAYFAQPSPRCDHCWIVTVGQHPTGVGMVDGPCTYVWIDKRTGGVLQTSGGCWGG